VKEKWSISILNTVLFRSYIFDAEVVLFGIVLISDYKKSIDFVDQLENQLFKYIKDINSKIGHSDDAFYNWDYWNKTF